MDNVPNPYPIGEPVATENSMVSTVENEEEKARKQLSYKRMTILFVVLALVVVGLIIWEIADLLAGGRP